MDPPRPPYPNAPECSPAAQPPVPPGPPPHPILNPPVPLTAAQMLVGTPVDDVFPRRANPGNPPLDGRTAALKALGVYLTSLAYCRPGQVGGSPVFFGIPPEDFLVERQGDEVDLNFPSMVCLDGPMENKPRGFQAQPDPKSRDLFGPGTVLMSHGEHEEVVPIEVWSSTLPELRAIVAKVEQAFNPTQERSGFLLRLADYYWQTARYMYERTEWPDDANAVKNRRMARVHVFVSFDVVRLVNYVQSLVQTQLDTEVPGFANPQVQSGDPTIGGGALPAP